MRVENEVISQKRRPCFHLNLLECCLTLTAKKAILSSPWLPVKRRVFWSSIQLSKLNYFTWTKNGTALSWQMFSNTNYLVSKHFQVLILNQICKYNAGKAYQWYLGFFFYGKFYLFCHFWKKVVDNLLKNVHTVPASLIDTATIQNIFFGLRARLQFKSAYNSKYISPTLVLVSSKS